MGNDLVCCQKYIYYESQKNNNNVEVSLLDLDTLNQTPNITINRKIILNKNKIILIQNYFRMFKKKNEIKNILKEKNKKIEEKIEEINVDQNKSIETTLDTKVKNKKKRKKSKKKQIKRL